MFNNIVSFDALSKKDYIDLIMDCSPRRHATKEMLSELCKTTKVCSCDCDCCSDNPDCGCWEKQINWNLKKLSAKSQEELYKIAMKVKYNEDV